MGARGTMNELVEHILDQTREGKLSLISLIENFSRRRSSTDLPTLFFDEHQRYIQLDENHQLFDREQVTLKKEILRDHSTHKVLSSENEDLFRRLSNLFEIPSEILRNQHHLALKNRLEIPPLLIKCLVEDARSILRSIIKSLDRDEQNEENEKRRQRICQRLDELEIYHRLFIEHC